MTESLVGFAAVLVLVLLRMPIAFSMGLVGMVGYAYETSYRGAISIVARLIIDTSQDYGLSVVPLFILMGLFVNKGGISRELYQVSNAFLGHLRGGLAMATIVACGGFAAICGSSLATAATMSKVAMPEMRKFGYADSLSTASIAAGGTLGILIPPSVILVIYGLLTETSIGQLFIAGIVPGVMGILFYMIAVRISVARNPESGPAGPRTNWADRLSALRNVWSVILLFGLVIGGLYGALDFWPIHLTFSPTEAAGMGAMGAFLIALFRGNLPVSATSPNTAESRRDRPFYVSRPAPSRLTLRPAGESAAARAARRPHSLRQPLPSTRRGGAAARAELLRCWRRYLGLDADDGVLFAAGKRRQRHVDRVRVMFKRCAGHGVGRHADQAADHHIAGKADGAVRSHARRDRDFRRVVAGFRERDGELVLAVCLQRARRDAGEAMEVRTFALGGLEWIWT